SNSPASVGHIDLSPATSPIRFEACDPTATATIGTLWLSQPINLGSVTANGASVHMNINRVGQDVTRTFSLSTPEHIAGIVNGITVTGGSSLDCVNLNLYDSTGTLLASGG